MAWGYTVTSKRKDNAQNVYIEADFEDDANPGRIIKEKTCGVSLNDDGIDDWARKRINVYVTGDAGLAAITTGVRKVPKPVDPKVTAVEQARREFNQALPLAQVTALNDPVALAKYQALLAAEAEVEAGLASASQIET